MNRESPVTFVLAAIQVVGSAVGVVVYGVLQLIMCIAGATVVTSGMLLVLAKVLLYFFAGLTVLFRRRFSIHIACFAGAVAIVSSILNGTRMGFGQLQLAYLAFNAIYLIWFTLVLLKARNKQEEGEAQPQKDNRLVRFSIAAAALVLLWSVVGLFGLMGAFRDLIWSGESVVNLRSFLVFRTLSFVVIGLVFIGVTSCVFLRRMSLKQYTAVSLLGALLVSLCVFFFIPECSPIHILYGKIPTTNYRDGFRPSDFLRLTIGMTKAEVEETIGFGSVPFCSGGSTRKSSIWMYSGPGGKNYWRYWLHFNDEGILQELNVKYWWD